MSSILHEMARHIELQGKGQKPIIIQAGEKKADTRGIKTSTVVVAILVTVFVVSSVTIAVILINRDAEKNRNVNLVHIEDESDEDWQDLSDYPKMLEKSRGLKQQELNNKDPNFTLLKDLR